MLRIYNFFARKQPFSCFFSTSAVTFPFFTPYSSFNPPSPTIAAPFPVSQADNP